MAEEEELDRLREDFPSWHIWRSQVGRLWATRLGRAAWERPTDPDFAMTVDGDSARVLRAELTAQNDAFPERPLA